MPAQDQTRTALPGSLSPEIQTHTDPELLNEENPPVPEIGHDQIGPVYPVIMLIVQKEDSQSDVSVL
jgi:hypothetical protein